MLRSMLRGARFLAFSLLLVACQSGGSGTPFIDRGVCDTLIACASELAPESHAQFVSNYGPAGTCWAGGPNQWPLCRQACVDSLDAINLIGQATGQTCGGCQTDADCSAFGPGATCEAGTCVGDEGVAESAGETADTADTADTTDTADTADTADTGDCPYEAPDECLQFVDCITALVPDQAASVEDQYGADGSCWCGTEAEAAACYDDCISQLEEALEAYPTVGQCQESYCPLSDLDPTQPYGPVVDGMCPNWDGAPQAPLVEPLGLPGTTCSPACEGLANYCPEHTQTSAQGTCYVMFGDDLHCVSRCYVDSTVVGGSQCQCGATCQPQGAPDGEGNMRGICTFE